MKTLIDSLKQQFRKVFFDSISINRLERFRIIFPLFAILAFLNIPWANWADLPQCLWSPPGAGGWLLPHPLSFEVIKLCEGAFVLANLALAAGQWPRSAAALASVALGLLVSTANAVTFSDRSANPMILTYAILAATPNLGKLTHLNDKRWPIRLIQFNFFFTFFAAGVSKLARSGWRWTDAENLIAKWNWSGQYLNSNRMFEIQDYFHAQLENLHGFAGGVAALVVSLELGALVFFVVPALTPVGAILFALFQTTVFLTMYIPFTLFIPLYLAFLPLERLGSQS